MLDRVFLPCDYTEAKIESIFLHTYNWVCLSASRPVAVVQPSLPPKAELTSRQQQKSEPKSKNVKPNYPSLQNLMILTIPESLPNT